MRHTVIAALAVLAISATAAQADPRYSDDARTPALLATGAVAGTVVGLGLAEGWWGSSALAAGLGSTAAAATAGGVAGVGTVALIHAATTPCTGFDAVFGPFRAGPSGCIDGRYAGAENTGPVGRRRY